MLKKFLLGTTAIALNLAMFPVGAHAEATLDAVMERLNRIEKENAELKKRLSHVEKDKVTIRESSAVPAGGASGFKGNPIVHDKIATSPGSAPLLAVGGHPIISKDGPMGSLVDNTFVTLYGHGDVSFIDADTGVYDQRGWQPSIASNGSYFGIRARHDLTPYGYDGWNFLLQFESQVDVAATPTERAALGTRDSYVGIEGPWGAVKIGKTDSPYKRSTASFDPFANTLADYNSMVSNTGGDNRAEFDWRLTHAIWYESPIIHGFQFSALFSPGQNTAPDDANFAYGDFNCPGSTPRGSGSGYYDNTISTGGIGGYNQQCTDGSFGNAYSTALVYKDKNLTAIGAFEYHDAVNRHGDDGLESPLGGPAFNTGEPGVAPTTQVILPNGEAVVTGVHPEWAAKVGIGYNFDDPWGKLQLYAMGEMIRRVGAPALFNERSDEDVYASATQYFGEHWSVSAAYTHEFPSPGSPGVGNSNNFTTLPLVQFNTQDRSANQYSGGVRYRFNQWASVYLVGTVLANGPGAHNCLGASGMGYQICGRDEYNNYIAGQTIKGISSGFTFDF